MSATLPILESIRARLLDKIDRYAVELFPDDLANYHLKDEDGAILIQYAGSKFALTDSTSLIQQQRDVYISLTILSRSQHDDHGALEILDKVRLAIVGFRPTNCEACALESEQFEGEEAGVWMYQLMVKTETWQVELVEPTDSHLFVQALYRRKP